MFRRFVSGSAIASIAIALAVLVLLLMPGVALQRVYPLPIMWCFAPAVWGLWAMCAPVRWVPQRFPLWGAILGLIAGLLATFVLNLPARILGDRVPITFRAVAVVAIVVFYYFLWMLVRVAYRSLGAPAAGAST
jgi:hypothetical protein